MSEISIDPVCLVGLHTYHQKNVPNNIGASYGSLYAQQVQLTYNISMSAPLGTSKDSPEEIIKRMVQYQSLRSRKSKDTINFLDEYIFVGWYVIGTQKYITQKNYIELLCKQYSLRGAPYYLILDINSSKDPQVFLKNRKIKYIATLQPLQKLCTQSMNNQNTDCSAIKKLLTRQQQLVILYNEKLNKLLQLLAKENLDMGTKKQIIQSLETYQRLQLHSDQKLKTIEAINYSVLSGLIIDKQNFRD